MTTESTSTLRDMPEELFNSLSDQFDALTQAIEDAGFPVLHTCMILRGETNDTLSLSGFSAIRNLQGDTAIRMSATASAQTVISGITSVLKDETGNIIAERLQQLIPLTKTIYDMFISFFTRATATRTDQILKEAGCSVEEQTELLMSAFMSAVENLRPKE